MRVRGFLCVGVATVLLPGAASSAAPARPAIWFAPLPPLRIVESRPYVGSTDFMQLFGKKAAWPSSARRVSVFKLYGEWVAYTATGAQLRRAVGELKRRRIGIAVEEGPLDATAECGRGLEGFAGMQEGLNVASRIKSAGGMLRYVAFDEPFFFGALYSGSNACRWDARRVARGVAAYIRGIRTVFPRAEFGDTEPLTTGAHLRRYEEWIDAYGEATGERLAFLHLDVSYTLPRWPQLAGELEEYARSRGVPFGIIYNGDAGDVSDRAWLAKAQRRFELYETEGGHPDHAVLQSWVDKPDRVLPERRRTFTNLILRYARPRPRLRIEASGDAVTGRLTATRPVAGARIRLSVERALEGSAYPPGGPLATASAKTGADGRFRARLTAAPGAATVARYPGSSRLWPAYAAAGGGGAVLRNVARGRPVTASAELATAPGRDSVDGDATNGWNAGAAAPQWIEIDLGATLTIAAVRLGVEQFPDGDTVHVVLGRAAGGPSRELHVFRGRTTTGELLEYVPSAPWAGIRYLRVETRSSPSWVAWREIEVFASATAPRFRRPSSPAP